MKKNRRPAFAFYLVALTVLSSLLGGCASTATVTALPGPKQPTVPGSYHTVKKGQTLWRICKAYGVDIEEVTRINQLADATKIEVGQRIFIPGVNNALSELLMPSDFKDKGGDFIWPLHGKIGSFFGMKNEGVRSKGITIEAQEGTAVRATRSGKIAFCSQALKGLGKTIIIDHLDGYSTVYSHNAENLVAVNQMITQGETIAKVGSSGRAQRPELYFEIRKGEQPQNPFFYLP
ncbi:MAG: LysM peptidoglycan-binding domain-containing M23 family metallopeptidase [Candidatus Omnitrophota bacterium]